MSNEPSRLPNRLFAQQDENFRRACEAAGVQPTARQASKYRRRRGNAYKNGAKHGNS